MLISDGKTIILTISVDLSYKIIFEACILHTFLTEVPFRRATANPMGKRNPELSRYPCPCPSQGTGTNFLFLKILR